MTSTITATSGPSLAKILTVDASENVPNYSAHVSAVALLIWDIAITFDQEIELIWKARHSVIKYVFLFFRYITLCQGVVTLIIFGGDFKSTHNICRLYGWYYSLSGIFQVSSVDIILVYRAYAFYERDRKVLIGLAILWLMNTAATLTLSVMTSISFQITYSLTYFVPGVIGECGATSAVPRVFHNVWISEVVYQSVLFFLVLGRYIKIATMYWKTDAGMSKLYYIFIRDGIWAYFVLFVLFFGCTVWNKITVLAWIQWAFVFAEISGSRLVLNLRSLYADTSNDPITPLSWRIRWANTELPFDSIYEPEY